MIIHCQYSEEVKIEDLKPHPKNRNKHSDEQIDRLCKILEYQGWRYPIKVSNLSGFITSGHGRLLAAKKLKLKSVPVSFQNYESEEQEYADVQADNAIASWAELDLSGINLDIVDLGPDFDIEMLGLQDFLLEPAEKFIEKEIEWTDKFEGPGDDFKIVITCKSKKKMQEALERLKIKKYKTLKDGKYISVTYE